MNKRLIALATAAALALPVAAVQAGDVAVSGYAESVYNFVKDAADSTTPGVKNAAQNKFTTQGEIDVVGSNDAVSGRIDLDVSANAPTNTSSVTVEQAYVSWQANDQFTINAGTMNTPMGLEAQDSPNRDMISNGQIFDLFEHNIDGATADFNLGTVNLTVGILDEVNGTAETNSFLIAGNVEAMEGLNIAAAFRTADDKGSQNLSGTRAGNAWDVNAAYEQDMFSVYAEIFGTDGVTNVPTGSTTTTTADKADIAWAIGGSLAFNDMFSAAARYDSVSYNPAAMKDTTSFTIDGIYNAADNLDFKLEWRSDDDGTNTDSTVEVQGEVTFGDFE